MTKGIIIDDNYWNESQSIPATKKEMRALLSYEINMFTKTCNYFGKCDHLSIFERNLLIESMAIHTRVLVDFFYQSDFNHSKHLNDIYAQDLLSSNIDWEKQRPVENPILKKAKHKADKQLAHLSKWRIKIKKDGLKEWGDGDEIFREIEKVIQKFKELKGF